MKNSRYCGRCACEALCGAQRTKFKPRMRFCGECDSQRVAKRNEYVNATGVHRYGPDWGVPLQVAAFLAFLLSLLQPGDVVAYLDLCEYLPSYLTVVGYLGCRLILTSPCILIVVLTLIPRSGFVAFAFLP